MSEIIALLPCPHCAGKADFNNDGERWDQVICGGCGCRGTEYPNSREKAAAAWNRRAPTPIVEQLLTIKDAAWGLCDEIANGGTHQRWKKLANLLAQPIGPHTFTRTRQVTSSLSSKQR